LPLIIMLCNDMFERAEYCESLKEKSTGFGPRKKRVRVAWRDHKESRGMLVGNPSAMSSILVWGSMASIELSWRNEVLWAESVHKSTCVLFRGDGSMMWSALFGRHMIM